MNEITTSEAGEEAAGLLAELHRLAFADGQEWSSDAFLEMLKAPGTAALIAGMGERPLGMVVFREVMDEAEIITIGVLPQWRGRGVGKRLLAAALAGMAMNGARRVFLEVAEDNAAAIALYESAGFVFIGRRKGYYARSGGKAVDALMMTHAFNEGCGCDDG